MDDETNIVKAETIENKIEYETLISTIEEAFRAYHIGDVTMPPKSYVDVDKHNGDFRSMPAYIHSTELEASGIKWVNVHPNNTDLPTVMAVVIYNDPQTGFPLAVMDGTEITKLRTGAVAGVATDQFAPEYINTVGIVGAGVQSYEQIRAIEAVRDFDRILVSDPDKSALDKFRSTFENDYRVNSHDPQYVASNCDVLSTTTPVEEPIISSVNDNIHINAMGADAHQKQEFVDSVLTSDNMSIFVDDMDQAVHSGEVSQSYESGMLEDDDIGTLGQAICEDDEYSSVSTMFDSTGLAIQDIATAHLVYENLDDRESQLFKFV